MYLPDQRLRLSCLFRQNENHRLRHRSHFRSQIPRRRKPAHRCTSDSAGKSSSAGRIRLMIERPVCLCLKIGSWLQFFNKGRLLAALDSHKMPRQSAGNKANYAFGASNHCPTKAVARPCNTLIICRYSLAPTPVSPEIYKVNIVQDMSSPPLSKSHRGRCPIRYDLTQIEVKNESKVSKLVFKYLLNCVSMPFILPTDFSFNLTLPVTDIFPACF